MDAHTIITLAICGTILLTTLICGLTTMVVAHVICDAVKSVWHDNPPQLPVAFLDEPQE